METSQAKLNRIRESREEYPFQAILPVPKDKPAGIVRSLTEPQPVKAAVTASHPSQLPLFMEPIFKAKEYDPL